MAVALSSGGGAMMPSGGGMQMAPPMPSQVALPSVPRGAPRGGPARGGPARSSSAGAGGADLSAAAGKRSAVDNESELSHGGDACLCVEFSGATVCAAAWDSRKREAVGLPVGTEGSAKGCSSRVEVTSASGLAAWLAKPPKARAAEVHTSGCTVGGGSGGVVSPGLALGLRDVAAARKAAGEQDWIEVGPDDDEEEDEEDDFNEVRQAATIPGSRVAVRLPPGKEGLEQQHVRPEEACALLLARPRQRATQLVAKPVRRLVVVAPAGASQAWRLAAFEACVKIDARCVRLVSAHAALALAHRAEIMARVAGEDDDVVTVEEADAAEGEERLALVVDVVPVQFGSREAFALQAATVRVSRRGVAVEEASPTTTSEVVTMDEMGAAIEALKKNKKTEVLLGIAAVVVRGAPGAAYEKNPGWIRAEAMDAVLAAASFRAAELGLAGAKACGLTEALPSSLGVKRFDLGKEGGAFEQGGDELFAAQTAVPSSVRRDYERLESSAGETLFGFVEDGALCGSSMEDPFETVDDDGDVVLAKSATVEYRIDRRGLLVAQVIHVDAPKSKARQQRERSQTRCRRIAAAIMAAFFLTPVFYTLVHMRSRAVTRRRTIKVLTDFYKQAAPDKLDEIPSIVDKYEGFEHLLFNRLERRYPDYKINRNGDDDDDDTADASPDDDDDDEELLVDDDDKEQDSSSGGGGGEL